MQFSTITGRLMMFLLECKRVLAITRKPTKTELWVITRVTGIGILIIGLIGFLLQLGKSTFF